MWTSAMFASACPSRWSYAACARAAKTTTTIGRAVPRQFDHPAGSRNSRPRPPIRHRPHDFQSLLARVNPPFELRILRRFQHLAKPRPRAISRGDQVRTRQKPRRTQLLRRQFLDLPPHEIVVLETAVARHAIQAVQLQVLLEPGQAQKPL